ncbi:CvpA family protein [Methylomonas sp. AM2-LC]|uniref:CvpA family protein n=1 Tax=Methylomonas sp. AM2-LC TaxID=3153301 RepID=UPI0032671F16
MSTNSWVWVDYTIVGIVLFSAVLGLFRGFIKEALAMLIWIVAFWVGSQYCHEFSALFQDTINQVAVRTALAFVLLFIGTVMLGSLISFLLSKLVQKSGLKFTDRLLGLGFGVVRGFVLVGVLVLVAGFTPLPEQSWWRQSKFLPSFQSLAVWLKDRIPSNVADYIKFR